MTQNIAILEEGLNGQRVAGGNGNEKLIIDSQTLASHPLNYDSYSQLLRDINESFFVLPEQKPPHQMVCPALNWALT